MNKENASKLWKIIVESGDLLMDLWVVFYLEFFTIYLLQNLIKK